MDDLTFLTLKLILSNGRFRRRIIALKIRSKIDNAIGVSIIVQDFLQQDSYNFS